MTTIPKDVQTLAEEAASLVIGSETDDLWDIVVIANAIMADRAKRDSGLREAKPPKGYKTWHDFFEHDHRATPYLIELMREHRQRKAQQEASPAPDGWRPIETAPKDASALMLGIVRRGTLKEIHIGGYRYAVNDDEISCWWSDQCDDVIVPTHWQPLPAAPKEGE